jgi:target of EGR1 protein 1
MGNMDFTKVTSDNISGLLTPILDLIRQAHYIAVDTEFSGHGPSAAKHMDQRYQDLSKVIQTHTLLSFGLTVVTKQQNSSGWQFSNIEFLTRNQHSFRLDPSNIKFLAENGLDFTQIFRRGIPFSSGSTVKEQDTDVLRQLWHGILMIIKERQIPLVVHNGLLDIMYLYESFFASLPETLSTLVADLVEMFPAGIYDTKHLATDVVGEQKSFLAYLYCKYQRQSLGSSSWCVGPPLSPITPTSTESIDKTTRSLDDTAETSSMKRRKRMKKYDSNKKTKSGICGLYAVMYSKEPHG